MQFTYRNPQRSTDTGPDTPRGRGRWWWVPGATGARRSGELARWVDRRAPWPATPAPTTTGRCAPALGRIADRLAGRGVAGPVVVDDNALVDRAAAQRAGLGWFGRNTMLLLPGLGSWFVLGSVVTDAPLAVTPPSGASRPCRGMRDLPALRGRLPHRGAGGRRGPRRPALPGLAGPGPRHLPARVPGGPRGPDLRLRRVPAGVPDQPDRRPPPSSGRHPRPDRWPAVDLLDLLAATDAELLEAHGRWYIAERDPRYLRRNALVALGNIGDARPGHRGRPRPLGPGRRRAAGRARPMGGRPAGLDRARRHSGRCVDVTHLLVTNDFPPKVGGIQAYLWELWRRLDPSTFVVLPPRPIRTPPRFDAEQAARGIRIERVPPAGAGCPPRPGPAHPRPRPGVSAPTWWCSTRPSPGPGGTRPGLPYAVLLHGAEVAIPGRLPASRSLLAHVVRDAVLVMSAGGYPAAEARRAVRGRGMPPVVEIPPGVDLEPVPSLWTARSGRGPGPTSASPPRVPLVVSVSRLVPRKGMDVLIDAIGAARRSVPGPHRGHRRSGP